MLKYLLLFLFAVSCTQPNVEVRYQTIHDTIYGTVYIQCDSIKSVNDSLKTNLFLANYKIEKVKFYLKIVERNPSQIKFLRGWCIRAVE